MIESNKLEANFIQKIVFFSGAVIASSFVLKNILQMKRYCKSYQQLLDAISRTDTRISELSSLKLPNLQNYAVLQNVIPHFPPNYFKNIEDATKFTSDKCKFYEKLVFQNDFSGTFIENGKQHHVHFQMKRPCVGFQISKASRTLQKQGLQFHKDQRISVYGQLSYSGQIKKIIMKTHLLGLDNVQLCKFWQLNIVARIFSTFFFSIFIGVAISIYKNRQLSLTVEAGPIYKNITLICDQIIKRFQNFRAFQQMTSILITQQPLMKFSYFAILIITASLLCTCTLQCHYSCKTCSSQLYTNCLTCSDSSLPHINNQNSLVGACINNINPNANLLGIFFLIIVSITCIIFMSQQMYYFFLFFQTISILYILQVPWISSLNYVLSAMNYLMIFTRIQFSYKHKQGVITKEDMFKSTALFKTTNLVINIQIIGVLNILLVMIMIIIPCFKAFRKRVTDQRVLFLPNPILDKILLGTKTLFLIIIQETVLIIYYSLSYGIYRPVDYIIVIIYFGFLIFFVVNQWVNPFTFFRGKLAQLNIVISKILIPIFVVIEPNKQFTVFIFMIMFLVIDILITNKNRFNTGLNRLLFYKIIGLLAVVALLVNYIIDSVVNRLQVSKITGYLALLIVCLHINTYILEVFLEGKQLYDTRKINNNKVQTTKQLDGIKEVTMTCMDNKQFIVQLQEQHINPLILFEIKSETNERKKQQFEQSYKHIYDIIEVKFKEQPKKQLLEMSIQTTKQKQQQPQQPANITNDIVQIKVKQRQMAENSNLTERSQPKQQIINENNFFQKSNYKIRRRKINQPIYH